MLLTGNVQRADSQLKPLNVEWRSLFNGLHGEICFTFPLAHEALVLHESRC